MTNLEKKQIQDKLQAYISAKGSQNKAANTMPGVSSATISQVLNNNWEKINNQMWRKIGAYVGWAAKTWEAVQTRDYKKLNFLLEQSQDNSVVYAITGEAGTGKSFTLKSYASSHNHTYLLSCNEYWNRKYFLSELLTSMGRDYSGLTVAEMMMEAVSLLKKQECPLIIFDEADKLSDQVLYFFITLYNQLEDHCGLVLIATDHLKKRIKRGLKLNKKGYKEIYSRVNRKFIELSGPGVTDITQICLANGIENKQLIKEVFDDSEGDLRRVKQKITAYLKTIS